MDDKSDSKDTEKPPSDDKPPLGDSRCALPVVFGNIRGAAVRGMLVYCMGANLNDRRTGIFHGVD